MTEVIRRQPLAFSRRALRERLPASDPENAQSTIGPHGELEETRGGRLSQRSVNSLRNVSAQQAATGGLFILAGLFLISMLFPVRFFIYGLLFQPYKLWLMIIFIPLIIMLFKGKAGKPMLVDWLMIGSTVWVLLSFLKNHGVSFMVITGGTHILEFLGAYLLARLAIRSGADFRRMVILLFVTALILLPFTVYEAISGVPILAELLASNWLPTYGIGGRMNMRRVQSVFEHPILYGAYVSTMFGLVWYALIPNAAFVARMFLVSFIGFSTLFSLSTGAFLAIIAQIVLIGWEILTRPHPKRWWIFGWLVVIAYFTVDMISNRTPFHVLITYAAFDSHSSYNRILIFEHGSAVVRANPIFGIGLRDWPRPRWMSASVDNFWLLIAMRHGLPALVMFAAGLVLIMLRSGRQTMLDPLDRACRAGYLTAVGGIIVAGGTVHYWKQLLVFVMFIFGSGVWMFTGGARSPAGSQADPAAEEGRPHASRGQGPVPARRPLSPPPTARPQVATMTMDVPHGRQRFRQARRP